MPKQFIKIFFIGLALAIISLAGSIFIKTNFNQVTNADNIREYVDAASGDATLDNQASIMGSEFDISNDSLNRLSAKIDGIVSSDASYEKQLEIEEGSTGGNWVESGATFYSTGGDPYFCQQHAVNGSGQVTITNINEGYICRSGNSCGSGSCGSAILLSYLGTNHTNADCASAGGTIFDTGTSGTLCKFFAGYADVSCPSGWSQADYWQRYGAYSCGTAPNYCKGYDDSIPLTFSNTYATDWEPGALLGYNLIYPCANDAYYLNNINNWPYGSKYQPVAQYNSSSCRIEIGCK